MIQITHRSLTPDAHNFLRGWLFGDGLGFSFFPGSFHLIATRPAYSQFATTRPRVVSTISLDLCQVTRAAARQFACKRLESLPSPKNRRDESKGVATCLRI